MPLTDASITLSPCDILVVDDERQVTDILHDALAGMGHRVVVASDGMNALEKLQLQRFDVVITDMDMPRMDGMELIRFLAAHHQETDIIAITGHVMRYKYTDVISAGAADFITKPFSLNELEAKLRRLLRERYLRNELERLAVRDSLTGLYNRRFFDRVVRREATRAMRYSHPLFLFFFDLDHFKLYNDQHGHQAGDTLLVAFAQVLKRSIREDVDTAFRYGGDEFTVLLPHLPADQAIKVAERIRQDFNALNLKPTCLSVGIAEFRSRSGKLEEDVADMIRRADTALYHAKRQLGGDRVYCDDCMSD